MNKYDEWISEWLKTNNPRGRCMSAIREMNKDFPELISVCGFVYCERGEAEHGWLKTKDGKIVDPTASQFKYIGHYEEYKDGMAAKIGVCVNCGIDIFAYSMKEIQERGGLTTMCSDECSDDYVRYLNNL